MWGKKKRMFPYLRREAELYSRIQHFVIHVWSWTTTSVPVNSLFNPSDGDKWLKVDNLDVHNSTTDLLWATGNTQYKANAEVFLLRADWTKIPNCK